MESLLGIGRLSYFSSVNSRVSAKLVRPVTSRVFKLCDYLNELGPERPEERIWQWPTWLMEVRIFEPILPHVFVQIYIYMCRATEGK